MRKFEIFYDDLTIAAQVTLCRELQTSPEEENWDTIPLSVIEREEKGEEE